MSELVLVNVEVFVIGEGDVFISCYGSGNVDCFISDSKVFYVMNGCSFWKSINLKRSELYY